MTTRADIIKDLTTRIKTKSRFDSADNSINKISPKEYEVAIESALDLINEYPPLTTYTLEQIWADPSLVISVRSLLVDLSIRECVFTLAMDWLANSEESETIEQFTISSKYNQYRELYDALWSSNEDKLASVKKSIGVVSRGSSYVTDYAVKISGIAYKSNLINRLQKSLRGTML